ncbi:hypothetical protein FIBSPDRAFT_797146 [Athelia psychrophila]|uniref:Macrofage activating glycoprotein n=1 Tax=Athelia psychrophila TaxID=1759441 RepID=A0A166CUF2_9AGAM|nr:hypothetical protein FIBSPDRAFT_797146 [Fibularhizoctonia sp. CBS 109695]
MVARISLLAAALVAVHSFVPVLAEDPSITAAPLAKRTPTSHHDLAKRQSAAATYETTSPLPLTQYSYPYNAIPEQVNPYAIGRGPQSGYNVCNSTTEGAASECQTMVVNSLNDFCVWGSPTNNGSIGDVEAAVVGYCTQPGHGTRIITPGSITAAQFMKTSAYIQVTGLFDQTGIGLASNDTGGELDPHGADLLGNPIGGLVYSTGMPTGDNKTYMQVTSWNNFVGGGQFCIKLCDPTVTSVDYCQNIFDLLGCAYNMPASYTPGEFTSCEGELQDPVGTYTSDGQTLTWSQPALLPATSTLPWTPRVPASSNCVTYQSSALFAASGSAATGSPSATGSAASKSGASGSAKTTASSSTGAAGSSATNGAGHLVAGSGLFAVLAAVAFLL